MLLKPNEKPAIKLESYMGTPMLVLYYGPDHKYNLRLTKKKIVLLEAYLPIAKQFVAAIEAKKLDEFKKDLEGMGFAQEPVAGVSARHPSAPSAIVAEPRVPVVSEDEVTF